MIDLLWPFRGSGLAGSAGLFLFLLLIVATVPGGWAILRYRVGASTAGPLWLLLLFEVLACSYALLTPPWQMPDETNHMLHVELARTVGVTVNEQAMLAQPRSPAGRAFRQSTDEILHSMEATHAEHWLPFVKPLREFNVIPGPSELSHPPAYYALASVVTRPVAGAPIVARLAAVRALGVALAGWVVWTCGAVGRLVWRRRPKRAEIPMALALAVPGFCALAGSVSNDRLAELVGALLIAVLVAGVLERTRLSRPLPWALSILVLCVVGVLTKRTLLPLLILVPVAVGIRLRHHVKWLLAGVIAVEAIAALIVVGTWSPRLALWEREPSPAAAARCPGGHDGKWAICLDPYANVTQHLPLVRARDLAGSDLQLSFWVRAPDAPTTVDAFVRTGLAVVFDKTVPASDGWAFFSATGKAPADVDEMWLTINNNGASGVYVDDVVVQVPPAPVAPTAGEITAEGGDPLAQFHDNQIVNGSGNLASAGVPTVVPTAVQRGGNSALDAVNGIVRQPRVATSSVGLLSPKVGDAFGMYWGTAGWHLPQPLFPPAVLVLLGVAVAVAVAGAVSAILRRQFPAGGLLLLAAVVVGLATILRDLPPTAAEPLFGRYLYPALVAQTAVLAAGLGYYWRWSVTGLRNAARASIIGMHGLFLATVFLPFVLK
jgi:hypothetical protein